MNKVLSVERDKNLVIWYYQLSLMKTNLILVLRILIAIAPLKKENVSKYVFFLVLMESTN